MKEYPFFNGVPQTLKENLEWRLRVRTRAEHDVALQKQLWAMCEQDFLFFLSGFCWFYEPRPRKGADGRPLPTVVPAIPWVHQIPAIQLIDEALGYEDIGAEKSRGEGASWLAMMFAQHRWTFFDNQAIGLVSRNELAVDNPDDPDSLMWKLDFELKKLPPWMAGEEGTDWTRNVSKHVLRNLRNGSTITGYAATGDVASGGRKTFFVMDELAKFPRGPDQEALDSTGPVTESRFIISTPKGAEGAYYNLMHSDVEMVKIVLDWKDNPYRNPGMFRIRKAKTGEPNMNGLCVEPFCKEKYGLPNEKWLFEEFIPKDLKRLTDRGFATNDENKMWSRWYVKQCLRPGATPQSVAQEYDRDYGGSVARFFNAPMIDRLIVECARPPLYTGDLVFEATNLARVRFTPNPAGPLQIWCPLYQDKHTPRDTDYVIGCDVAAGMGGVRSSNSTIVVCDRTTGHKVAEYASPTTPPEMLANMAIALCMFFGGRNKQGYLIWETNGYGGQFRNRVLETPFRNFYYRSVMDETSRRRTKKPGFTTQRQTKRDLLGQYAYALGEGLFTNPSRAALNECKEYMILPSGRIEHIASCNVDDPAGAGENHGDRVIADALCNWVMFEAREGKREEVAPLSQQRDRPPSTSILGMKREAEEKARRRKPDYW